MNFRAGSGSAWRWHAALVRRPKMLLLDEPLGALDKRLREAMQIELRQLQKSVGITFVFVTHDQEEALAMSDRIAVMSGGRILQVAGPRELYEAPNCREVADFIGTINFFDGIVREKSGDAAAIDAGPLGPVRAAPVLAAAGEKVLIALRPEKIALSSEAGIVKGTVGAVAYLGERCHYNILVEGLREPVSVAAQNTEKTVTRGHAPGDAVWLSWAPEAVAILPCD